MTDTFEDLRIAPVLVAGVEALGWDAPSGLQRDAVPVIRRGNNVVLHASPGSGAVGAYGLGVLDRLVESDETAGVPGVLILAADASAIAESLARLASPASLAVRALAPGWTTTGAHILVATPGAALDAVRGSALKLGDLSAVVIDGAERLVGTDQWAAVETLVDAVPGAAQRVLVTGRFDDTIAGFVEGHVRKAMTVPPRSGPETSGADAATVRYTVVTEPRKTAAAVQVAAGMSEDQVAVVCRTVDRAEAVERALSARGAMDGPETDGPRLILVLPRTEADQRSIQAGVLSFDVPFDADELVALHGSGGAVLVTPRERAHFLRIAARVGLELVAVGAHAPPQTSVERLRDRLRELARMDLTAEMALLEPLLAELPAAEVAAAAIRLRGSPEPDREATGPVPSSSSTPHERAGAAPPPGTGTWVHLFVTAGDRDGVGPGDIVGAITGEAGVSGDQVGKIDIRESHSTVEVATEVAGKVIEALNGRTLRGRSLRVDYDRKNRGGSGQPPRRPPTATS